MLKCVRSSQIFCKVKRGNFVIFFINHFITSKLHMRLQPNLVTGYLCLSILRAVIYKQIDSAVKKI